MWCAVRDTQGTVVHSAQWPSDPNAPEASRLELVTGKRVVLVGTGASAIQILPEIAKVADRWVRPEGTSVCNKAHCSDLGIDGSRCC